MHKGVGRLLLESEISAGSIIPSATRRTAFAISSGYVITAQHCSVDASHSNPLLLRLPAPDNPFEIVDLPVRIVDEDRAIDIAVLELDRTRPILGSFDVGQSVDDLWARIPRVPLGIPAVAEAKIRAEGYPQNGRPSGLAVSGKVVESEARLLRNRAFALQLYIDELAASIPQGPGGLSGGPVPVLS